MLSILSGLVINIIPYCTGYYGKYTYPSDVVYICDTIDGKKVDIKKKIQVLGHELGHRNRYKYLSIEDRNAFENRYTGYMYYDKGNYRILDSIEYYAEMYSYSMLSKYLDKSYFQLDWNNYEILEIK